jgi:uncharacterized protein (TIGR00251 family)
MASRIWVSVKPQSKTQGLRKLAQNEYEVSVHAPPREGKANHALIDILAEHFSVPKSEITIVRGHFARRKLLEIG